MSALSPKLAGLLPRATTAGAPAGSGLSPQLSGLLPTTTQNAAVARSVPQTSNWGHFLFGQAANKDPTWRSLWGLPDAAASIATGTAAQVAGGLAGLGDLAWTRDPGAAAQTVRHVEHALTYRPRTAGGQALTHLVSLPFAELGKGANWAGGKVADLTGSPLAGAVVNMGVQGLPLMLGANAPELRDAAPAPDVAPEVASARDVGIKLTPNQAQVPGGVIGRTVESLAGHAKLERSLSRMNADAVTQAAGREIGVEGPLSRASLQAAKTPPNAVYAEVSRLGQIPTDPAYRAQIAAIRNPGGGSFAFDTPPDIARLKEGYGALPHFDAGDAVAKVRQLRRDAGANIGSRYDPAAQSLGHAQRAVADALEDQIDRHLQAVAAGRAPVVERAAPVYDPAKAPLPARNMGTTDASQDSVLAWLAKHPKGISTEEAVAQGLDPADLRGSAARVGLKRAFRQGGMSFDQAAEALHQAGYPVADEHGAYSPNVLLDALDSELRGRRVFSAANTRQAAEVAHEAATAPQAAEPPDLTDLMSEAMKANPQRAQSVLDGWTDDEPATLSRVQSELQAIADSAKPPAPRNDLIDRYRAARTQLAKINNVEQALKAGKGQAVSALNLAKQLDRGAPLTGDLRRVAEAAQHFPRALQDLAKIRDAGPFSNLDFKLEGGLGILKPLAALKALPVLAAQPVLRGILGSDLYQNAAFGPFDAASEVPTLKLAGRALPAIAAGQLGQHPGVAHLLSTRRPPSGVSPLAALLASAPR